MTSRMTANSKATMRGCPWRPRSPGGKPWFAAVRAVQTDLRVRHTPRQAKRFMIGLDWHLKDAIFRSDPKPLPTKDGLLDERSQSIQTLARAALLAVLRSAGLRRV